MIGVEILGRLGNQMFQFAFARIESNKLGTDYFLLETNKLYIQKYFEIDFDRFQNTSKSFRFRLFHYFNKQILTENQQESPVSELARFGADNTIYKGFYQSAQYFEGFEKEVKALFKIRKVYSVDIRKTITKTQKPLLAVHVRLTDYKDFGYQNRTLSKQYYTNCFERLKNLEDYEVWILSDDIGEAKLFFSDYADFHYAKNTPLMTDFQIMQQADALIVANSSFSWWAAYLSEGKIIFAPHYWLGVFEKKEQPCGISENLSWQWIDS